MVETLYDRIRLLRNKLGYSQEQLALKVGYADKTSIAKIEAGKVDLPQSKIIAFANALNTSTSFLMDGSEDHASTQSTRKGVVIPVLGSVAAGIPIEAIEYVIDTEEIPQEMAATGKFFGLKIKGNSMEPRIKDGDIVIVRQQEDAESGDIVIACVNGDEATCKRLRKYKDGIELISNNPSYDPMFFSNQEIAERPVTILGRVVELRAKL